MIKNLFNKANIKKEVFPENLKVKNNFISYSFIKGNTLYNSYSKKNFISLLNFLEKNLWDDKFSLSKKFIVNCKKFYYHKTIKRINMFLKKNKSIENNSFRYKGLKLDNVKKILNKINWKYIFDGLPKFIHGDLQFDNILIKSKNKFKLIDWRPSFGNSVKIGDQYYDFAKLLGGLEINYDLVKKNKFKVKINKGNINLKIPKRRNSKDLINYFEKYIINKKFDIKKVRILTGLIFLNMSPLHHDPFDKLLFFYGKYYFTKNLI